MRPFATNGRGSMRVERLVSNGANTSRIMTMMLNQTSSEQPAGVSPRDVTITKCVTPLPGNLVTSGHVGFSRYLDRFDFCPCPRPEKHGS